jgi:hypothetical protein
MHSTIRRLKGATRNSALTIGFTVIFLAISTWDEAQIPIIPDFDSCNLIQAVSATYSCLEKPFSDP